MIDGYKEWWERPPTQYIDWGHTGKYRKHEYGQELNDYDRSITKIWYRPDNGGYWLLAQDFVDGCGWYFPKTWFIY